MACAAIGVVSKGHAATVLVSIPISDTHTVDMVEYLPGVNGTVEHHSFFDTSVVTPEVRGLGLVDLYRYLVGATAIVPDSIVAADARAKALQMAYVPKSVPQPTVPLPDSCARITEKDESDVGVANASEVQAFLVNYCAYADIYVIGYDYTELYKIDGTAGNWKATYFLGSDTGRSTYVGAWYWDGEQWGKLWGSPFEPGIGSITWRGGGTGYYFAWNIGPAGSVDEGIAASFF